MSIRSGCHRTMLALLSNTLPVGDEERPGDTLEIGGEVPTPINVNPGCRFASRCPYVFDRCRVDTPVLRAHGGTTDVACHLYD